jgi:hypothetical protein
MTRFRIVQRPWWPFPNRAVFEVDRRYLFWWRFDRGCFLSVEEAEQYIERVRKVDKVAVVETKVIKEYD